MIIQDGWILGEIHNGRGDDGLLGLVDTGCI